MSPVTRRRILHLSGLGVGVGLAGCSSLGLASTHTAEATHQIGAVGIMNDRAADVTASVVIIRDGNKLYWDTHRLAGDESASDLPDSVNIAPPTFEAGTGAYIIGVRVEETNESAVLDMAEMAKSKHDDCYFVLVSLTENGPAFASGSSDEYTNCIE